MQDMEKTVLLDLQKSKQSYHDYYKIFHHGGLERDCYCIHHWSCNSSCLGKEIPNHLCSLRSYRGVYGNVESLDDFEIF